MFLYRLSLGLLCGCLLSALGLPRPHPVCCMLPLLDAFPRSWGSRLPGFTFHHWASCVMSGNLGVRSVYKIGARRLLVLGGWGVE